VVLSGRYCQHPITIQHIEKKHRITFNSDGSTCVFKPSKKGLFFSDVKSDIVLVNTVDSIKNKYTVKEYSNAWSILDIIGQPTTKDFIRYVEGNMLPNFPINKSDILCIEEILGPNLGSLKEKLQEKHNQEYKYMH